MISALKPLLLLLLLGFVPNLGWAAQNASSQGEISNLLALQMYCHAYTLLSGDLGIILGLLTGFVGLLILIFRQMHYVGFVMILGGVCLTAIPAFLETTLESVTQLSTASGITTKAYSASDSGMRDESNLNCEQYDVVLTFIQQTEISGAAGVGGVSGSAGFDGLDAYGENTWQQAPSQACEALRVARTGGLGSSVIGGGAVRLSSCHGKRPNPCPKCSKNHKGVDLTGAAGTPILSYDSGTVASAGYVTGLGYSVVVDHGNGVRTVYSHLQSNLNVSAGQSVSAGTQLGGMGSTGYSTGNHLDFRVQVNGDYVDPCNHTNVCS